MANQPPQNPKPPESHYDPHKLGFYFAIVAVLLLMSVGGLLMKDYSREWKDYQKDFRTLEIEKTRVKYDKAQNDLAANSDYTALEEELKKEKQNYAANCSAKAASIQKELEALKVKDDLLNQNYKFRKTSLDVAKFQYEAGIEHQSADLNALKSRYDHLTNQTNTLKLAVEDSEHAIKAKNQIIDDCGQKLKELTKKESTLTKQSGILDRKLRKIDPAEMNIVSQYANYIRDFPIIDLSNPNEKVQQIVLKDITEDVNFMQVPKVDRCITCHLGIANPDYKDAPQPFKTHPNLELYLGNNSPHPMEEFGCTVCHQGRGRGTSFNTTVHTPSSEKEKEEWIKKYHWEEMHHWDEPMLPLPNVEASCFKCHSGETVIKGAEKLNFGMQLIERAGCYSCHLIDKYKDWPKTGPDLTKITSKTSKEWVYRWIIDPKSFRYNTWMPSFFNQSNNNDPESVARSEQEVHAIVDYLFAHTDKFDLTPISVKGDIQKGEELVASIGCFACHQISKNPSEQKINRDTLRQQQGPNLIGLGSKTSTQWVYNWLKDPNRYHPQTKMPNLRLSDQEAADIAEYLTQDKNVPFEKKPMPAVNEKIIDAIALDYLTKTTTQKDAEEQLAKMSLQDKLTFSGEKLIAHYGCYACHNIKRFDNAKPIGTELTEEGSKPADKLDFGFIDIEHSKEAWFHQKLKDPRIFDKEKVRAQADKLVMPNFNFNEEEADAITTVLLGLVKDKTIVKKKPERTVERQYIEEGEKIIRQLNCQGCHIVKDEGGAISKDVKQWLVKYDKRSETEADNVLKSFSPPNLHGVGLKVKPDWLFEFLHNPTDKMRPWLKVRMPTYNFNTEHLNLLVKYFNAVDKAEFPFIGKEDVSLTEDQLKESEKLFVSLDCMKCHIIGDKMPSGTQDTWAPNLVMAKKRLRPGWILDWVRNPQKFMPNTKMPAFLDTDASGPDDIFGGDENVQVKMLRNYLMTLTHAPETAAPAAPAPAAPPAAAQPTSSTTTAPSEEKATTPTTAPAPATAK